MKTTSMGFLKNNAWHDHYHEPSAVNVIKYGVRKNKNPQDDLITYGGIGVMEFLGINSMRSQIEAVQQMRTRKGDFGRYIDHEFFSLTPKPNSSYRKTIWTLIQLQGRWHMIFTRKTIAR